MFVSLSVNHRNVQNRGSGQNVGAAFRAVRTHRASEQHPRTSGHGVPVRRGRNRARVPRRGADAAATFHALAQLLQTRAQERLLRRHRRRYCCVSMRRERIEHECIMHVRNTRLICTSNCE